MSAVGAPRLSWGAATDVGLRRASNEDGHLADPPVFVVADGMGGHVGGEIASECAVEAFRALVGREGVTAQDVQDRLVVAHRELRTVPAPVGRAPATTVSGVIVTEQGGVPYWLVLNLGDSRTYRLAGGELEQVSVDHSEVQELVDAGRLSPDDAALYPGRNIVTRALDGWMAPEADFWLLPVEDGDRFVVCSDGLTGELDDAAIAAILLDNAEPQAAASALVAAALDAGGRDNVTVVVVDAWGTGGSDRSTGPRPAADGPDVGDTLPRPDGDAGGS